MADVYGSWIVLRPLSRGHGYVTKCNSTIYGEDFERAEVPFYGDDGLSWSSSLNDDEQLITDSSSSYLEPEFSTVTSA
eukprot:scaffold89378_cov57-Cyclotella_meneghiniana.AAC.2